VKLSTQGIVVLYSNLEKIYLEKFCY